VVLPPRATFRRHSTGFQLDYGGSLIIDVYYLFLADIIDDVNIDVDVVASSCNQLT
jgi:aspartate 1-decarboxylase